jgi:dolichol-phosphate mannosyltransferase
MGEPRTSGESPSLAVVVPMYDEQEQADRCARLVCQALDREPGRTALVVVDDGSRDATPAILARLAQELPRLSVVTHEANRGYGAALQTGAARAAEGGFDYVLFMDSDLTNDPALIPVFRARAAEGYDVIKASRFAPGGGVSGVPFWRRALSIAGNRLAAALFRLPIRDCTNGFRAVRTSVLRGMALSERGFPAIMEELYQARYLARRFCEVPYTLTARTGSQRSSSFSYRPGVFVSYLKYPLRAFLGVRPAHLRYAGKGA